MSWSLSLVAALVLCVCQATVYEVSLRHCDRAAVFLNIAVLRGGGTKKGKQYQRKLEAEAEKRKRILMKKKQEGKKGPNKASQKVDVNVLKQKHR